MVSIKNHSQKTVQPFGGQAVIAKAQPRKVKAKICDLCTFVQFVLCNLYLSTDFYDIFLFISRLDVLLEHVQINVG